MSDELKLAYAEHKRQWLIDFRTLCTNLHNILVENGWDRTPKGMDDIEKMRNHATIVDYHQEINRLLWISVEERYDYWAQLAEARDTLKCL